MRYTRALLCLITVCVVGASSISVAFDSPETTFENLDPGWLDSWKGEIDRQVDWIASAYALSEDEIASLRGELEARVLQQHEYDEQMRGELAKIAGQIEAAGVSWEQEDSPLVRQYAEKFHLMTEQMPLNDDQVSAWMDSRVTPERAQEGRLRLKELQEKALAEIAVSRLGNDLMSSKKSSLGKEAVSMTAETDPVYNRPVPTSDLAERVEAMDRLNRVARNIEPTRGHRDAESMQQQSGVPQIEPPKVVHQPVAAQPAANDDVARATPPPSSPPRPVVSDPNRDRMGAGLPPAQPVAKPAAPEPPPQPAPPLDEWEKYVLATADKYGFDDAQLTNARSILSDLRRRAYQYQTSRAEAFARVELITDAKAREVEKKALNKPLDALFAELKSRLESLPTQSQRQKAGQPAKR